MIGSEFLDPICLSGIRFGLPKRYVLIGGAERLSLPGGAWLRVPERDELVLSGYLLIIEGVIEFDISGL